VKPIILADASPHAQRMGESILRSEGFQVASVTDSETLLKRLADVDPAVVILDIGLPNGSGYDLCRYIKAMPRHAFVRVVLTAGAMADFSEDLARNSGADATLRKPFEASVLAATVRPLAELAERERNAGSAGGQTEIDRERIRAAVTLALDAAMPAIINELADRVIAVLRK
jgi:DNA-binding response OmpR family regulator